jgi:hypothetical protein
MACPKTPRLDGKLAVVTGGNAGVGFEIGRELARRSADLVIASRDAVSALAAYDAIARETRARPRWTPLDLSDLDSVVRASDCLQDFAPWAPLRHLRRQRGGPASRSRVTMGLVRLRSPDPAAARRYDHHSRSTPAPAPRSVVRARRLVQEGAGAIVSVSASCVAGGALLA